MNKIIGKIIEDISLNIDNFNVDIEINKEFKRFILTFTVPNSPKQFIIDTNNMNIGDLNFDSPNYKELIELSIEELNIFNLHYKNYIGQYVKRFYNPFDKESIYFIKEYKIDENGVPCFLYFHPITKEEKLMDCEDSCIITNETPIKDIEWVANVNDKEYKGYNPFNGEIKE